MNAKLALPALALAAVSLAQSSTGHRRQPVSPTPNTVEELQVAGGGVPRGYMILGDTPAPPSGYSFERASLVGYSWWTSRGAVPAPPGLSARLGATAVTLCEKVYLLGGGQSANPGYTSVKSVDVFDPTTQTWTSSVPMQASREWFGAAELNGRLIVAGGWSYSPVQGFPFITDSVEEFDPIANTWSSLHPLSTPRSFFGAAVVNGKLYVVGGSAPGVTTASVEAYDPSSQTWSSIAPLITPRYQHAVVASNGKLYAFGGSTTPFTTSAEEYDPLTNSWRVIASPMSRTLLAGVAVRDRVFAIGGRSDSGNHVALVEEYDPLGDRWIPWAPMPSAGFGPAAYSNGLVFVFGVGIVDGVPRGIQELEPGVRLFVHRRN